MNVYAVSKTVGRYFPLLLAANCFATTPTLTVNADDAPPQEDAWGPAATLAAKNAGSPAANQDLCAGSGAVATVGGDVRRTL